MGLDREENYRYQKLALTVLEKALDDICPKFEGEPVELRQQLITERIAQFKLNEKELDAEWKLLEKEAVKASSNLKKNEASILAKLEKTRKTKRIKAKIKDLRHKKKVRIAYLTKKLALEDAKLQKKLLTLDPQSKKFAQINRKLENFRNSVKMKIDKTETRYESIIDKTEKSDNSLLVDKRLVETKKIWARRYKKLQSQYTEKESIFENKSYELDQIRRSVQAFVEDTEGIKHWCIMAGINLKVCYLEVQERLKLLGRNSLEINDLIQKIGETNTL